MISHGSRAPTGRSMAHGWGNSCFSATRRDLIANKAASTAWSSQSQTGPGAFCQEDTSNPYVASSIDPRVDKVPRTQDTGVGNAPTDHNTTAQSPVPQTSTTSDTAGTSNSQGIMGRALGAIGLGGAAATDSQTPTTTTGTDSYATPAQSSGMPSHHRKESIQPLHTHLALWILLEQWLHLWVLLPPVILQPLQMNLASEVTLAVPPSDRHPLMAHIILALVNPRQASPTRSRQIPLPTASQRPRTWDGTLKSEQALAQLELA
jgi:hypothetical protein